MCTPHLHIDINSCTHPLKPVSEFWSKVNITFTGLFSFLEAVVWECVVFKHPTIWVEHSRCLLWSCFNFNPRQVIHSLWTFFKNSVLTRSIKTSCHPSLSESFPLHHIPVSPKSCGCFPIALLWLSSMSLFMYTCIQPSSPPSPSLPLAWLHKEGIKLSGW